MNEYEAVEKILEARMQRKVEDVAEGMYRTWTYQAAFMGVTALSIARLEFSQLSDEERSKWIAAAKHAIAYRDTL